MKFRYVRCGAMGTFRKTEIHTPAEGRKETLTLETWQRKRREKERLS